MSTDTGTAPVMTAGASAAEIAVMRQAAGAFAERFAPEGQRAGPGQFEQLARPWAPCDPGQRTRYEKVDGYHWAVPYAAARAEYIPTVGAWHLIDDQVTG